MIEDTRDEQHVRDEGYQLLKIVQKITNNQWEKWENHEDFVDCGEKMLNKGFTLLEVENILVTLFNASVREFNN